MKASLRSLFLLSIFALVFTSCSIDKNSSGQQTAVAPDESLAMQFAAEGGPARTVATNPHRSDYEVVIVDGDGWELCMNRINSRYGVLIYDGILWFSFGSVESTHGLSAAYYPSTNTLTITAHEDYFTGGAILAYSYEIGSNYNSLTGFYHYMEHRYKSAPISGDLIQGSIGGFGPSLASSSSIASMATSENAKSGLLSSGE